MQLRAVLKSLTAFALGQVLALNLAGTGVGSQYLSIHGCLFPTLQSSTLYILLLVYLVPLSIVIYRRGMQGRWWGYFICALLDVEANTIVIAAYQLTTMSSVMFLDCFSIPVAMVLSTILLRHRYSIFHAAAVVVAVTGMIVLIIADASTKTSVPHSIPARLLGDVLCLVGTTLYALSNVLQERLIRHNSPVEFLAMVALFATPIALIQGTILGESWGALHASWTPSSIAALALFLGCMFLQYSAVPCLLLLSSASFMNMSFLTSDLWGLGLSMALFGDEFSIWYLVAGGIIFVSLVVFLIRSPKAATRKDKATPNEPVTGITEAVMSQEVLGTAVDTAQEETVALLGGA